MSSKAIIWAVIGFLALYELLARVEGWQSISSGVRQVDDDVNGLLRWVLLGLWMHFFVGLWPTTRL